MSNELPTSKDDESVSTAVLVDKIKEDILKPGRKTSEFWLMVLVVVGSFGTQFASQLPPAVAIWASVISGGIYTLGRFYLKAKAAKTAK